MGTRARIGLRNPDNTVTSIYTHWDGYPEHHWPILTQHYNTIDRVRALLALGDLSILDENIGEKHDFDSAPEGVCTAYGRDRGEKNVDACLHAPEEWPDSGQEFEYVFDGERWLWRQPNGRGGWKKTYSESISLWIDDERPAPHGWRHARSSAEAIAILTREDVIAVSFDHDLGEDDSGYRVVCWLEERAHNGHRVPTVLDIHSANPIGRFRMQQAIDSIRRVVAQRGSP